jgi:predicted nucleic acid-binding protein
LDDGLLQVVVNASSVTDIHYVVRKGAGPQAALDAVRLCLDAFQIGPVDKELLEIAYFKHGDDFEDDLQIVSAERLSLDAIVTRDASGFSNSSLLALTPVECRTRLGV